MQMKSRYGKMAATFGALLLALVCVPSSWAGCAPSLAGPTHSSWDVQPGHAMPFAATLIGDDRYREPSIVGFWHFKFFIGGQEADAGNQQWHSDGTEILNSGLRPPIIGDFCLGVWQQVGPRHYRLNHRGLGWNDTGTAFQETDVFLFDVYLSPDGNSYTGTFTLNVYDEKGAPAGSPVRGTVTASRITVNTLKPGPLM
jgi:hypothetical protein